MRGSVLFNEDEAHRAEAAAAVEKTHTKNARLAKPSKEEVDDKVTVARRLSSSVLSCNSRSAAPHCSSESPTPIALSVRFAVR